MWCVLQSSRAVEVLQGEFQRRGTRQAVSARHQQINKEGHEMNITLTPHPPRRSRVLRLPQVIDAVGLSKATIYRLAQMGKFPKPFKIGITAVGWDEAEIEFWILERKMEATLH